jgi:hypothetical protein
MARTLDAPSSWAAVALSGAGGWFVGRPLIPNRDGNLGRGAEARADVVELPEREYEAFLTAEIQHWKHGFTLHTFIEAYQSGRLDDGDPEVTRLVALLDLLQNGQKREGPDTSQRSRRVE